MKNSIILYGPGGCGKSYHSKQLAEKLGLDEVLEIESSLEKPKDFGALMLVSKKPERSKFETLSFATAMALAGIKPDSSFGPFL